MKKIIKILLISIVSLLTISLLFGLAGYFYFKSNLLDFEEKIDSDFYFNEIDNEDGITFFDFNKNGLIDIYEDETKPMKKRVDDLLKRMSKDEKIRLLKGTGIRSMLGIEKNGIPGAAGKIVSIPRLGLNNLYLADGPAGLRISSERNNSKKKLYSTAFPVGSLISSSWDKDLAFQIGQAMGSEAKSYGIDIILGPGMNLHRNPLCGRNFEYFSEDPVLSGNIAAGIVNGIQTNNVGACPKHFVVNNQETDRMINNAIVDERTLRELYLKGFEIMIKKSRPWAIMSSYNRVNGKYVSVDKRLLTDILRDEWNYNGIVMTDWFGGGDTVNTIKAGNDLIEPGTLKEWEDLKNASKSGKLSEDEINASAGRILKLILNSNKFKNFNYDNSPDLENHAKIARKSGSEGMVLLKNQGALPLKKNINISLIGVTSFNLISGGTGSGDVDEAYTINIDQAFLESGFQLNKKSIDLFKKYNEVNPIKKAEGLLENLMLMIDPNLPPEIEYTDKDLNLMSENSDIAVLTIGRNSGEGKDRVEKNDFLLSDDEKSLIERTCKAFHSKNKKVVIILNIGGVIETESWKYNPDAILLVWQAGQESGNSIVDIISGKVNPSGKLPMTFPINIKDHRSTFNFPLNGDGSDILLMLNREEKPISKQVKNKDYTIYEEGLYVGYKHFEKEKIDISYPFGYGLSYTEFEYSDLDVQKFKDTITISFNIKNSGNISGKEIAQIYYSKSKSLIDRPEKQLIDFSKTKLLESKEDVKFEFKLPTSDFAYWNQKEGKWDIEKGIYNILVGSSSSDIRLIHPDLEF